ncbi:MAG: Chitin synthase, class 7 [Watsoniomyces obsoletus]|nr:MAG: Chitin synthase, class 7 [Watsoniomyces obsoletus]
MGPSSPTNNNNKNPNNGGSSPAADQRRASEDSPSSNSGGEKRQSNSDSSPGRKSLDDGSLPSADKKRRSGKASALLASARNSLHLPGSSSSSPSSSTPLTQATSTTSSEGAQQTPLQKLGKQDPALAVPQGPHNNSAGESLPGARSTFAVGVTEDRNKKCRRTMEDTHSYLYNFLNTPAPALPSDQTTPTTHDAAVSKSSSNMIETDNGYFAIFDGHAGTFAADWCGKKLHGILEDAVRNNPNTPIPELLDQTFTTVDQELEKLPLKNSGCTAVIAVLRWEDRVPNAQSATGSSAFAPVAAKVAGAVEATSSGERFDQKMLNSTHAEGGQGHVNSNNNNHPRLSTQQQQQLQQSASRQRVLYTANVGDARIVLCRNGKALRLSYDHKGSDENEGKRVANAGGLILNNRVNGVLAVTRALGDTYMKELVTGHPYTTETVIQPETDEFIILACDGLWDVCTDQEAVDLIRNIHDPQEASKLLVDHALSRFSTDNLSCMIVRFNTDALIAASHHQQPDSGTSRETLGGGGGAGGSSNILADERTEEGISEAEKIVLEDQRKMEYDDDDLTKKNQTNEDARKDVVRDEIEGKELGPELSMPSTGSASKPSGSGS